MSAPAAATLCVPPTNPSAAERHLAWLFAAEPPGRSFELRALSPHTRVAKSVRFACDPDGIADAVAWAEQVNEGGYNVYALPARLIPSSADDQPAKDADVEAALVAYVDIDDAEAAQRFRERAAPLPPDLIVRTGSVPSPRLQAYWRLATPATDLDGWRVVIGQMIGHFGADRSCCNPSRVIRLAGVMSWPSDAKRRRGYIAETVTLETIRGGAVTIDELREAFGEGFLTGVVGVSEARNGGNGGRRDGDIQALLDEVSPGNWHEPMLRAVASLVGRGYSDWAIRQIVAAKCVGGADDPDLSPMLEGARRKGWGRSDKPQTSGQSEWPDPDKSVLCPERGQPPAFPLDLVFAPRWAEWVRLAADAKGGPTDYVAVALLAAAGAAIGNARWAGPGPGWAEPPVLWAMLIGPPSAGKSPCLDAALAPLRAVERDLQPAAEAAHTDWLARKEVADAAVSAWRDDLKKARKAGGTLPPKPKEADPGSEPNAPRLIVNDATVERLADILAAQPRGSLVVRDELSGWLQSMTKYTNGSDRPFWLESYGGRPYTVERVSRKTVRVEHLTAGVVGCIQPDPLAALLVRAGDDGLLARFIPVWPAPTPLKRAEAVPNEAFATDAFRQLHNLAMPLDEGGRPRPWVVPFTQPARKVMDELRVWQRKQEAAESGLMISIIGKLPGLAARVALVLAHLDWAAEPRDAHPPTEISAEQFARAAHLAAEYVALMARRCYAEAAVPAEEKAARALARIITNERWQSFTIRAVTRRERQGLMKASEVEAAASVLSEAGWIRRDGGPSGPKGGRPQTLFFVNPKVGGIT